MNTLYMYTMFQSNPHSIPSSPIPVSPYLIFIGEKRKEESSSSPLFLSFVNGYRTNFWSMDSLSKPAFLKKTYFLSPASISCSAGHGLHKPFPVQSGFCMVLCRLR